MKVVWSFFNVVAIVVISALSNLYFMSDGTIPIWRFVTAIPYLTPELIADAAGKFLFALFFGLFGFLYKPHRVLGFILVSWIGLFFMVYVSYSQIIR
ncbi:hypothetical protein [Marinobacter gelidimuriae]|uniref:hypothetical protein n=1 Tax=Marinobacter gelidimuriae TaxID=2739064 RepID=UPI00035EE631|nr:hypothetical protein [Marinobacter gelidimuriae]